MIIRIGTEIKEKRFKTTAASCDLEIANSAVIMLSLESSA